MTSISEGTLLITVRPHKADELIQRLQDKAIPASVVGEVVDRSEGTKWYDNSVAHDLVHPQVDPFWAAFGKAAEQAQGS